MTVAGRGVGAVGAAARGVGARRKRLFTTPPRVGADTGGLATMYDPDHRPSAEVDAGAPRGGLPETREVGRGRGGARHARRVLGRPVRGRSEVALAPVPPLAAAGLGRCKPLGLTRPAVDGVAPSKWSVDESRLGGRDSASRLRWVVRCKHRGCIPFASCGQSFGHLCRVPPCAPRGRRRGQGLPVGPPCKPCKAMPSTLRCRAPRARQLVSGCAQERAPWPSVHRADLAATPPRMAWLPRPLPRGGILLAPPPPSGNH